MWIINAFLRLLFFPGNIVLKSLGIKVEEDLGVLRSFVNSSFWGLVALVVALNWFI